MTWQERTPEAAGPTAWAWVALAALVIAASATGYATGTSPADATSPGPPRAAEGVATPTVAAGSSAAATASPTLPTPTSTEDPLEQAKAAAVMLVRACPSALSDPWVCGAGSGSLLGNGLILTNAHVAAPATPRLGWRYGYGERAAQADPQDPDYVVVSLPRGDDEAAVPTYRARVVAVDGYLDLAVLRIDATVDGRALPSPPRSATVPLGSVEDLPTGAELRVIGYPRISGALAPRVTRGSVSAYPPDRQGLAGPRWEIDTDAEIDGGNSGGLAIDAAGRLIGVPTFVLPREGEKTRRIRSIDTALPMIEAVRGGRDYVSPFLVPPTGAEQVSDVAVTRDIPEDCEPVSGSWAQVDDPVYVSVRLRGLSAGQDVKWRTERNGELVDASYAITPVESPCLADVVEDPGAGSLTVTVSAGAPWRELGAWQASSAGRAGEGGSGQDVGD